MAESTTRAEARKAIRLALLAWKADGVARPLIPVYADLDGDGIPDFYGLDEDENVIEVSGSSASVRDTVATSDGSGIEQGGGDS